MAKIPGAFLVAVLLLAAVACRATAQEFGGAAGFGLPGWPGGYWMPFLPFPFPFPNPGAFGGFTGWGSWGTSVVCAEKGPCFNKRLTCPSRCFSSYTLHSKNFGGGGGGGGCSFDCKRTCSAYC
ncbi:uncharacterized protein LOC144716447 [Wolffia australiana]